MTDPAANLIACLTPPGQGAIATLGLSGPLSWDAVRSLFQPRGRESLPETPSAGQFWLGRCGVEVADEVVLAVKAATLEIHSHGGRAVVRLLLDLFTERGLSSCSWQEFLRRTEQDSLRAAAASALADAATARTAAILLDQYHGAFRVAVAAILAALDAGATASARAHLGELVRWSALGRRLTNPWRVAVAGAPNVGKSSLMNALTGYQRSVVAPTPGTTRDVVTARIAVAGWPVELADTAGLRDEAAALERQGIDRARTTAAAADLCLWVLDATTEPMWPTDEITNVRLIVNKIDQPAIWDLDRAGDAPRVSALIGAGLPELCTALARWFVPQAPPSGAAVPFTPELGDTIAQVERFLEGGDIDAARRLLGQYR